MASTATFFDCEVKRGPMCAFCGEVRFVDEWADCFPGKHSLRCCMRCKELSHDRKMECCLCELRDVLGTTKK